MDKKRIKIYVGTAIFSVLLVIFTITVAVAAKGNGAVNWYCKNNDSHLQPELPPELSFALEHNAVYLDNEHGDGCDDKVLYLTFDAGYENGNVEKILNILAEENVKGAFFVLGHLIDKNTDLVKRMADEGHLVCNHTVHHRDMTLEDSAALEKELLDLEALFREKTGKELAKFYRPPEGRFNTENLDTAAKLGYTTVFWSFAYADWDNSKQMSSEKAIKKVLAHTHNGAVILLHPTSATNADILDDLIRSWKAEGYRFGTLDELKK